ncbi:hypothetical protein [Sulfitobacter sp.]|uniref:hypothetical protein n=1 Tax=Sulfitobacter sp. TaxID=1903071 RepID=UPI003003693A
MKNLWFLIAVIWVATGEAHAEKLILRSGDHPTFSRLTIPILGSQKWEGQQTDSGVELTFLGFLDGFEIEGVFSRMRRNRISNITSTGSTLTLEVSCECNATVFRSGSLLVIDVADNGTQLAGPALERHPNGKLNSKKQPEKVTKVAQRTLPWIGGNSPFGGLTTLNAAGGPSPTMPEKTVSSETKTALLEQTQKNLVEEVASAASAGLLESRYKTPVIAPNQYHPAPASIEPQALPDVLTTPSRNMRITSSIDHPFTSSYKQHNELDSGIECPRLDFLSVETWGNDDGFSAQVGPARAALMDARDQLDLDSAQTLAQLYIYFGFGAEALDVLKLFPPEKRTHFELTAIAEFFEYGAASSPNSLGDFIECSSNISLWASLSFHEIPTDIHVETSAALRALNNLPKHLRQIIAPALSQRLLKYGDIPSASAAMRSIERLADPLLPEAQMAQAKLAEEAGNSADSLLEDVLKANTTSSPEALVKIVEGKLAKDEPLSYETATLVEAYVQELRGTPMGSKLQQTQIIALSQTQRFQESLVALDQLSPSISPQVATELRETVLAQLSKRADDLVFLEHVFAQNEQELHNLENPTKLLIASRLLALGFPAQVQHLIATIPKTPRSDARQLLAARAALSLGQPFQAQAELIGISEPAAAILLAQAKEMTGAFSEASEIFSNNNAPEKAIQAAWLSEDWQNPTLQEATTFGAISTLMGQKVPKVDPDLGPLGLATRALMESRDARGTLQKMLDEPIVQITPDS